MINFENGAILVASALVFASALTSRVSIILEKYGLKFNKHLKRATLWFIFSSLLLLTGYFYVAYLLIFRW